jgi:hypothetical protein
MAGLEQLRNVLHVIRAWLYPNHFEQGGAFDHADTKAGNRKNPIDFTFRKRQAGRY